MGKRKMDLPDESFKSEDKKKEPGAKARRDIPDLKRSKLIKKTPPAPAKDESDASSEYEQN